jgi:hypothetical protein
MEGGILYEFQLVYRPGGRMRNRGSRFGRDKRIFPNEKKARIHVGHTMFCPMRIGVKVAGV